LKNPFGDLQIDYLDKKLFPNESLLFFQYFKDACRYSGSHAAIEKLKKYELEDYKYLIKKIKNNNLYWRRQDKIWNSWEGIFLNYLTAHPKPFDLSIMINQKKVD
jgi:hypothetical protein